MKKTYTNRMQAYAKETFYSYLQSRRNRIDSTSVIHDRTRGYFNSSERKEGLLKGKSFTCRRG